VPESAAPAPVELVTVTPPRQQVLKPAPAPARVFRTEHEPRPGWSSRHDPRSLGYGVRARLGAAPLQDVDLPLGPVLDQGQEGECVGCGTVDATNVLRLLAGRRDLLKIDAAAALYHRAQQIDDVPGVDYSGTSVLAGMQAGVEAGYFGSYLWAFGTRDIASALGHGRPVVIGIPWLSGMYDTGPGGVVEVKGDDTGAGHCLAVVKLRMKGPQGQPGPWFGWLNSWGRSYGDGGLGWVHHRDLAALLHGRGEAAIPGPAREVRRPLVLAVLPLARREVLPVSEALFDVGEARPALPRVRWRRRSTGSSKRAGRGHARRRGCARSSRGCGCSPRRSTPPAASAA
jgi:hypothetical protein